MCVLVDVEEIGGIDTGIYLRRCEARMSEQFLKRTQIGASSKQVRCEAVAERMRRRSRAKPESRARHLHGAADNSGIEWSTANAAKQGAHRVGRIGAKHDISFNSIADDGQQRNDPNLVSFAADSDRVAQGQR